MSLEDDFQLAPDAMEARSRLAKAAANLPAVLDRLLPIARRIVGALGVLVFVTFGAVALIVGSFLILIRPSTIGAVVVIALFAALLAVPAIVLKLFHSALEEVLALPDWLRSAPDVLRTHGADLAQLVVSTSGHVAGSAPGGRRHLLRDMGTAGKLLLAAHRDLPEYGSALRLISPLFLITVAIALPAAVLEWFFALGMAFIALLSLAFA